jgi:hypothetical protein
MTAECKEDVEGCDMPKSLLHLSRTHGRRPAIGETVETHGQEATESFSSWALRACEDRARKGMWIFWLNQEECSEYEAESAT